MVSVAVYLENSELIPKTKFERREESSAAEVRGIFHWEGQPCAGFILEERMTPGGYKVLQRFHSEAALVSGCKIGLANTIGAFQQLVEGKVGVFLHRCPVLWDMFLREHGLGRL